MMAGGNCSAWGFSAAPQKFLGSRGSPERPLTGAEGKKGPGTGRGGGGAMGVTGKGRALAAREFRSTEQARPPQELAQQVSDRPQDALQRVHVASAQREDGPRDERGGENDEKGDGGELHGRKIG